LNLNIAVTKNLFYWESFLKQIGVCFSEINWNEDISSNAIVIVNSELNNGQNKKILDFVNEGGSLLAEAGFVKSIFNIRTKQTYIKYLFSNEKIFSSYLPLVDLFRSCEVPDNANLLNDQNGNPVMSYFRQGKGNVVIIPGNYISAISDQTVKRKIFPTSKKIFPSERVAKVSKGSIYHHIKTVIEKLFHSRNLPFVSLWNFPGSNKNLFLFRIDTDYGSPQQVDKLYNTLINNNIRGTWFIAAKPSEAWNDKYQTFEEQEIGLHCYRHRIFNSDKENFENFNKGLEILKNSGIYPKGIASPFGEWNESFNRIIKKLGFEYSSEFAFAYDSLPFFSDSTNSILQIPTHPISFGRLSREGFTDNDMIDYFNNVIDVKLSLKEPISLYTHPAEERYDLLDKIFKRIISLNIPSVTFHQYAEWWEKRNKIKWHVSIINDQVRIATDNSDKSFWFYVSNPGGENFISPLMESYNEKHTVEVREFNYPKQINPASLRKFTFRMLKDDILFYRRKHKH
jgi:peptidoglycan/xylan/chitin deacetylase (PgdA/CDA1 family)